eukprot:4969642-Alexandrium_andersonii.AAC.1
MAPTELQRTALPTWCLVERNVRFSAGALGEGARGQANKLARTPRLQARARACGVGPAGRRGGVASPGLDHNGRQSGRQS